MEIETAINIDSLAVLCRCEVCESCNCEKDSDKDDSHKVITYKGVDLSWLHNMNEEQLADLRMFVGETQRLKYGMEYYEETTNIDDWIRFSKQLIDSGESICVENKLYMTATETRKMIGNIFRVNYNSAVVAKKKLKTFLETKYKH